MSTGEFTMRQLLAAGVHFGHQTHRWNPLMEPYIHSARSGIHIIDLTQTVSMMHKALKAVEDVIADGGSLLLVGTKRQASGPIAEAAERCNQFHVNYRWLGGTLTNWHTVSNSIKRLNDIDERIESGVEGLTKKERLGLLRSQTKLQSSLGGIRRMESVPDMLFVIDVNKESLAVAEANKLGIPVAAVVDTNCSTEGIAHMIPGNDDSIRAINLYLDLVTDAALKGTQTMLQKAGMDIDESFGNMDIAAEEKKQKKAKSEPARSADKETPQPDADTASAASVNGTPEPPAAKIDAAANTIESADPVAENATPPDHGPADTIPDANGKAITDGAPLAVAETAPDAPAPEAVPAEPPATEDAGNEKPDSSEETKMAG